MKISVSLVLIAVLASAGCASGGANASAGTATRLERSIGTGGPMDVRDKSLKVIRMHQFEILREEPAPNLYFESRWRDRAPFADEAAIGITKAQTRVMVRANQRGSSSIGDTYSVDLTVENRVQRSGSDVWDPTIATAMYNEYVKRIVQDLKTELEIGVRR